MNKKKRLLFAFILTSVVVCAGTIMKLLHVSFANVCLVGGLILGFIFLYLLIDYLVKSKE
jgi:small neutral amino acid transporter SnatA (MarC family)